MRSLSLRRQSLGLIALIVVLMLLAALFGLLDGPELNAVNLGFQLRGPQPPRSPVVIVAIDDNTFGNTGLQWPWPRTYFAQLVDRLRESGARLIAFDVFLFEPEQFKPATYSVQGETFLQIAQRYGVEPAALIEANGLDNAGTICGGQTLTIPTHPAQQHTVVRDTIGLLAARYGVEAEALLRVNNLSDPCQILPADLLQIPAFGSVTHVVRPDENVAQIAGLFQVNALAVVDQSGQPARDPLTPGQPVFVQLGDAALAASLRAAGNVLLNGEIREVTDAGGRSRTLYQPAPLLLDSAVAFGISNIGIDADGVVHSILAWDRYADEVHYSWPLVAAAQYRGQPLTGAALNSLRLGVDVLPLDRGFLRVNYRGPAATFPTYSALQVVNGDYARTEPDAFRDRIVLIGATTVSLQDVYATPFGAEPRTPGVELMASALDTALSGDYLALLSGVCADANTNLAFLRLCSFTERGPMLISIALSGLMGLALFVIRQPSRAVALLLALIVFGVALWLAAFLLLRAEIPLVAPLVTLLLAFAIPATERAFAEELEKRRVRGIFELFISPEMVGQLIEQGVDAMRGKRAQLTILFSDIRGFTTMSEKMTPEAVVDVLNEYLGAMTDVIHKHGGTVDKYEGDLVMAFFGAPLALPDHAERAVRCSIDMRLELERLRTKWAAEGKPSRLEMGIGLNSAEVFVGLVGSGRRVNYTVMGDGVNLASRVQDLTKDLQWPLLVTEFTYAQVKDKFDLEFAEARLVKGKTVPVGMYRVLGEKGAPEGRRVKPLV